MSFSQNLYDLLDMKVMNKVIDSCAFLDFCAVDSPNQVSDGDAIGRFRNILIENGLQEKCDKDTHSVKKGNQRIDIMPDCIIIGGGAAGLMAAVTAADCGKSVIIFEKNQRVGKKLLITGKGRCNVTNNCTREEFFENIPTNSRFLYSAYSGYDCEDVMSFFECLDVPLKTERGNRVFPVSDRAEDIVIAFERAIKYRSELITVKNAKVTKILTEDNVVTGVVADGIAYHAPSVLIACGGRSYPKTGSDGDGFRFAKELGHKVTPLRPSLVPLVSEEDWCRDAMGLSLKNVTLTLKDNENG